MRTPKYHIYLTNEERSEVLKSLIDLKNSFIEQSVSKRYTRQKAEEKSLFLPPKHSSYIEHHVRGYDVLLLQI